MGSLGSRFQSPSQGPEEAIEGTSTSRKHSCECKKRKRNAQCDCDSEQEDDDALLDTPRRQDRSLINNIKYVVKNIFQSPVFRLTLALFFPLLCLCVCFPNLRRKKLKSTSRYIYQTLFLNGENSDICISALGQEWNLHKVYLCQSGYFSSMFSGSWKESNMMEINLEIPDQNIDTEALQVVFGSLYRDDVLIKPSKVVSILAAACMLQLDGLIQQCGETMKENISVKTVCGYYACASIYGLDSVMKKCLEWLLNNLMTHQNVDLMKELGFIMEQLIQSSDLFVMQVEMDVYTALKKWMFLQLNPLWDGPIKQLLADADAWLCKHLCEKEPFLSTDEGAPFCSVFKYVRLQYIINDLASARILERDNILPPDWLTSVYKNQWFAMLRTEFDNDNGPQEANREEFELSSMRCGRKLTKDGDYCWRWTGFNFGFDLLVTYTNRFIVFKRNTLSQNELSEASKHFKVNRGKLVCSRSTGYQLLTLEKDQEYVVMNLDSRLLSFPLYVCCNFLYTSPQSDNRPDSSEQESAPRSLS
uniref:BTB domain-containing protein n=1 Tax=Echeneis naucrates TaxID=173247 RepID=A0A665UY92_ECHNA